MLFLWGGGGSQCPFSTRLRVLQLQIYQKYTPRQRLSSQRTHYNKIEHASCRLKRTVTHQFPGETSKHQSHNKTNENTYPANSINTQRRDLGCPHWLHLSPRRCRRNRYWSRTHRGTMSSKSRAPKQSIMPNKQSKHKFG